MERLLRCWRHACWRVTVWMLWLDVLFLAAAATELPGRLRPDGAVERLLSAMAGGLVVLVAVMCWRHAHRHWRPRRSLVLALLQATALVAAQVIWWAVALVCWPVTLCVLLRRDRAPRHTDARDLAAAYWLLTRP